MKNLSLSRFIPLVSIASVFAAGSLQAATVSWSGTNGDSNWSSPNNWNGNAVPGATDDVVIAVNTGLNASRRLNVNADVTVQSITGSVSNLMLRASGGTRTLTVGGNDTEGASFINLNLNRSVSDITFTGATASNTLFVEFGHHLTLSHIGSGETAFGGAKLRNTSNSTGTDTISFAGSGNWAFLAAAADNSSAIERNSANATLNVELKNGLNAFTGTLRYASTNAMNVDNVQINSGRLLLDSARIITTGTDTTTGLIVDNDGTLAGDGIIFGSATINGKLQLGGGTGGDIGVLTFKNGLTLQSSAQTYMQINGLGAGQHDAIFVDGNHLTYAGDLIVVLSGTYNIGDSWVLFSGFDSADGFLNALSLNGINFNRSGDIWTRTVDGIAFQFNQQDGILSVVVIPEPSSTSLILLTGLGLLIFFRSKIRRR